MIELIFIILIIGILASVAVPKLLANRDDAMSTVLLSNARTCINDLISGYKGQGITIPIDSVRSCAYAREKGATVEYSGDYVHIANVSSHIDGDYIFKGTKVSF